LTFKDKGIVLKETHVGESDKMVTVLLHEHGKINLSVRGARKPGSKFLAAIQPFCLSEFVVFVGKGFYSVTQAHLLENFYELRTDFDSLCHAAFFAEMTDKLIYPEMPASDVLALLYRTLFALSKQTVPPKLASAVFQFKFLQLEGYSPETEKCSGCGESITGSLFFGEEGLVCRECVGSTPVRPFTEAARYSASYILNNDIGKLFTFTLSEADSNTLYAAAEVFRNAHLEMKFKSLLKT